MSDYQIKILLVEDNPGDARLIQESLADAGEGQFNVETADRLATALLRLAAGGVDATLLDLALPDSTGWDTFEKVRVQSPGVPIIVLTGLSDDALAVKMVQKGAQDFVAKVGLNGGCSRGRFATPSSASGRISKFESLTRTWNGECWTEQRS